MNARTHKYAGGRRLFFNRRVLARVTSIISRVAKKRKLSTSITIQEQRHNATKKNIFQLILNTHSGGDDTIAGQDRADNDHCHGY